MIDDYITLVTDLVRDDAGKASPDQIAAAIGLAVERYSLDRPVEKVEDLANVAGMLLALPAGWEGDFSALRSIEYPLGQVPPAIISADRWALYRDTDGLRIMLIDALPVGSTVRVTYTTRHRVAVDADTISSAHREAVAKYAAALLCDQLAAFYANDTDSTIHAGLAQGQTKSQAYAARGRDYRKQFLDALGVTDKTSAAASAVATVRLRDAHGRSRLFHPPGGGR